MKVAVVHYHLRPGGVTRVIENAVAGLEGTEVEIVVLAGAPESEAPIEPIIRVEDLGYRMAAPHGFERKLADYLETAAREGLGRLPDIWHIHNHSLGKNVGLPGALRILADRGARILFQIHDFAEDGRPENYNTLLSSASPDGTASAWRTIYPAARQFHYAALNTRDLGFLSRTGIPDSNLHLLPNPVAVPEISCDPTNEPLNRDWDRLTLYPTRAIRRKNLGEFMLWAALTDSGHRFAATRGPDNPIWLPIYERWQAFANACSLPVSFGVAERSSSDFAAWMNAADSLISTSVAEGFGLAFLEPFSIGKPLVGRNLPEITDDFHSSGIDLSGLYRELRIPLAWIDEGNLESMLIRKLARFFSAYHRSPPEDAVERWKLARIHDHQIDFAALSEPMQESVILRVMNSSSARTEISPVKLGQGQSEEVCRLNARLVSDRFGVPAYGERLIGVYSEMMDASIEPVAYWDGGALLDSFLRPERFLFMRS